MPASAIASTTASSGAVTLVADPADDIKKKGADGKPLCIIVGYLMNYPNMIVYARNDGSRIALVTCFEDRQKLPLQQRKSHHSYDDVAFHKAYDGDWTVVKTNIKAQLSSTDMPSRIGEFASTVYLNHTYEGIARPPHNPRKRNASQQDDNESNGNEPSFKGDELRGSVRNVRPRTTKSLNTPLDSSVSLLEDIGDEVDEVVELLSTKRNLLDKAMHELKDYQEQLKHTDGDANYRQDAYDKKVVEFNTLEKELNEARSAVATHDAMLAKLKVDNEQLEQEVKRLKEALEKARQPQSANPLRNPGLLSATSSSRSSCDTSNKPQQIIIAGVVYKALHGCYEGHFRSEYSAQLVKKDDKLFKRCEILEERKGYLSRYIPHSARLMSRKLDEQEILQQYDNDGRPFEIQLTTLKIAHGAGKFWYVREQLEEQLQ